MCVKRMKEETKIKNLPVLDTHRRVGKQITELEAISKKNNNLHEIINLIDFNTTRHEQKDIDNTKTQGT